MQYLALSHFCAFKISGLLDQNLLGSFSAKIFKYREDHQGFFKPEFKPLGLSFKILQSVFKRDGLLPILRVLKTVLIFFYLKSFVLILLPKTL